MTEANNRPNPDVLDQAVQALRSVSMPEGPPAHLVASTVEALQKSIISPDVLRFKQRRDFMFRLARYGSLATAAAILLVLGLSFFVWDRTASVTFAQVIENVKKAKSATFICNQKLAPQTTVLEQSWFVQGDRIRAEIPGVQEGFKTDFPILQAIIFDFKEKKALQLDYVKKTAEKVELDDRIAKAFVNPIAQLVKFKDQDAKEVGEEVLDGVKTKVYELKKINFLGFRGSPDAGDSVKIWADAKTGLPVKILVEGADDDKKVTMSLTFEKFSWNEKLAPEMFNLDVPKGFEVKAK